ncbi:hypothetical protein MTO96_015940 [Rhipicephalus appendiculatus]
MMAVRRGHATGLEADGAQLVLRREQVRNRPQKEPQDQKAASAALRLAAADGSRSRPPWMELPPLQRSSCLWPG